MKPTRKNTANHPTPSEMPARYDEYSVKEMPTRPTATMRAVWPIASRVLPAILPISSCRTGILVVMISTIRFAFSSTMLPDNV